MSSINKIAQSDEADSLDGILRILRFARQGEADPAEARLRGEAFLKEHGDHPDVLRLLGQLRGFLKDYDGAFDHYVRAYELSAEHPEWLYEAAARAYRLRGDPGESVNVARAAIERFPQSHNPLTWLLESAQGTDDESAILLEIIAEIRQRSGVPESLAAPLVAQLVRAGMAEHANALLAGVALAGNQTLLGKLKLEVQRSAVMAGCLESAARTDLSAFIDAAADLLGGEPWTFMKDASQSAFARQRYLHLATLYCKALLQSGRLGEVLALLHDWKASEGEHFSLFWLLGEVEYLARNVRAARDAYEAALYRTRNYWNFVYLPFACMDEGDAESALVHLEHLIKLFDQRDDYRELRLRALWQLGRIDELVQSCEEEIARQPLFAAPYHYLSLVARRAGDDSTAASNEALHDSATTLAESAATECPPGELRGRFARFKELIGVHRSQLLTPERELPSNAMLERLDRNTIDDGDDAVSAFLVARNESQRLPYLLQYYRSIGVRQFFVVDNDSTDATQQVLLSQSDCHVWHTAQRYSESKWGVAWIESLLRRYGVGRWCLLVDADEIFLWPDSVHKTLPALCASLEEERAAACYATLLDVYPKEPLSEAHYRPGDDFLTVARYFDRRYFTSCDLRGGPEKNCTVLFGGVRSRCFGLHTVVLNKYPLVRYHPAMRLYEGFHFIGNCRIAGMKAALLHFKYFAHFHDYALHEAARGEHWNHASEYVRYTEKLKTTPDLTLYQPAHSIEFTGTRQLQSLGILG